MQRMTDFDLIKKNITEIIKNSQPDESSDCINQVVRIIDDYKSSYFNQEERINMLLTNIPDVIWSFDIETSKFIYISPSSKNLCGYSHLELLNNQEDNSFFYEIKNLLRKTLNDRLRLFNEDQTHNEVYVDEVELRTKAGNQIWTEVISSFYKNPKNNKIELIGTSRDFTDRKNARFALKRVRERFKILTDLTIEGLVIHDNEKIVDANPAIEKLFGEDLDMIIGSSIYNFIHPDFISFAKEKIKNKVTDKYEIQLIRRDRSIIPVEVEANYIKLKNKEYRVAAIRDITKRKLAEEKIQKFTAAITQSPSAIVITDLNGNIEYVNPQFCIVSGYSSIEVVGEKTNILKSGLTPQSVYKELWDTISSGNIWKGELYNKKKDRTLFWENAVIAPIKNEFGKNINYIAIKDDITAKKEAEQELIKSKDELKQANATKDKFFSIIAHDLKNPFNIILGFSDLLLLHYKEYDEETRDSIIKTIYDIALKTFNLLENLLAWSRTQSGTISYHPKEIDLQTLINDCILLFKENADKKQINLQAILNEDLFAYADRDMIATVLRNLIINGIKFTERYGNVFVSAQKISDNLIQIKVMDTGIGINAEKIPIIFNIDRDWSQTGTEEESGTGLGLFLCKEFVEKNGGKIWLESKENEGTSFYFTIPTINGG